MEIWPGYVTHIQEREGGLYLICDISHRVLRKDKAIELLKHLYQITNPRDFGAEAKKKIVGETVLTR